MRLVAITLSLAACFANCGSAFADKPIKWPDGTRTAISLSYDDGLDSQLDNAVPALDRYGFRASFYLVVAADPMQNRLEEWRVLANNGHELGNHTIFHACSGSLPDRDWVTADNDLDNRFLEQVRKEVIAANTFLQALDGQTRRTFTPPCNDLLVEGQNYLPTIQDHFVAIKGQNNGMAEGTTPLWVPVGRSGDELIAYVKENTADGMLLNILFHGIGGDYLSVSIEAHDALLRFLDENRGTYWTDTFINITSYVNEQPINQ